MKRHMAIAGLLLCGLIGCTQPQTRLQADDEADKKMDAELRTIGKVASIENTETAEIFGVGLVIGLDGTGDGAPPGPYRTLVEDQLRKEHKIEHVKELLASKDTALVLLSARIPPGAHANDSVDVNVAVPRESRTTSLRGGRLLSCYLYNYGTKKGLNANYKGADVAVRGQPYGKAEGPVAVGFGDGDESARLRSGRIWGGGKCRVPRALTLVLNSDSRYAAVAQRCADRINETFHGVTPGVANDLAVAKDKYFVYVTVPAQYKLNLPHFIRVVRHIPLYQVAEADRIGYRRRLEEQLQDPVRTIQAALRLEALGPDSIPTLKKGLASEHPLVRFASAESLAYLGNAACGEELAKLAVEQPALRAFSLTALASLDEAISHVELRRLLGEASAETRYGAFHALHSLDDRDDAVAGEQVNDSFWLHRTVHEGPSMVHLATTARAEIVLFGEEPVLIPPFPILAGEFTVTAKQGDEQATITRTSVRGGKVQRQCPLKLEAVIRTMGDMGALYPDIVELLRRADKLQCLSCQVAVDAMPQVTTVYDETKARASDREMLKTHPEILAAKSEFGANPTLFETGGQFSNGDKEASIILQDGLH